MSAMTDKQVIRTTSARIPTKYGDFQLCYYTNSEDDKAHLALYLGNVENAENVLTRVHSECFTGDVLGSLRCDCGEQLDFAMQEIAKEGQGVIVYMRQEGRGIGLSKKIEAYNLQDAGHDTVDANILLGHQADEREYSLAALILKDLGVKSIRLLTNNPTKIEALEEEGIAVNERVSLEGTVHPENRQYLMTKAKRMKHILSINNIPDPQPVADQQHERQPTD
tara:strand:+ start:365101 stop:365769 length:669 start_codon:yes stop_codon:yes gene_type:complete